MNADKFVEEIWVCTPSFESLIADGLSTEEAQRFRNRHRFLKKTDGIIDSNPLLDLITRYDALDVSLAGISFLSSVIETEHIWQVGTEELDPLVIDKMTGEVRVEEAGTD